MVDDRKPLDPQEYQVALGLSEAMDPHPGQQLKFMLERATGNDTEGTFARAVRQAMYNADAMPQLYGLPGHVATEGQDDVSEPDSFVVH